MFLRDTGMEHGRITPRIISARNMYVVVTAVTIKPLRHSIAMHRLKNDQNGAAPKATVSTRNSLTWTGG